MKLRRRFPRAARRASITCTRDFVGTWRVTLVDEAVAAGGPLVAYDASVGLPTRPSGPCR